MSTTSNWINLKISDVFAASCPGDWGTDGTPEDGVPVLRSTNFRNNGSLNYTDLVYRKIEKSRLAKRQVTRGSVLIEKSGGGPSQPAGRVVYCDSDFSGTASNFVEVVKIKEEFNPQYIAFLLYRLYHDGLVLKYQQQTTGIINFKLNEYADEQISLPSSKPEQTKIAEILSTVDRAIDQTEALIAKQQRLKTGLMQDLLTRGIDEHGNLRSEQTHKFKDSPLGRIPVEWEFTNFGRVLSQSGGHIQTGPFGSQLHSDEYVSEGVPVVMPQDINRGMISTIKIARITEPRANSLLRHRMHQGDLVFARRGDLSRCAVIRDSEEGWLCGTGCLLMRPPTKVLSPRWTSETYQFFTTQLQVDINAVGSTMPNLNTGILSSLQLALPSITEQKRIEERLNAAEDDESRVTTTLNKLHSLKTALMQDLLTGRKRVTELLNE
ncbi:MAG: restriction endonuclease subunit S [Akkermansiaceae bacterium]|jgi:type I restriction enzyme S subunit|nr:restriction endonuclease subunit S [Luteolibacter sp.]